MFANDIMMSLRNFRANMKMTQEDFAKQLNVSRQAVSKWENGQSYPDISMLPKIAALFDVSVDELLNYKSENLRHTQYEELYKCDGLYWGSKIRSIAKEILNLMPPVRKINILEAGCGEGQAALFFARNGYHVDAFDIAESGLAKGRSAAQSIGVQVNFFRANLLMFEINRKYDVIYSSGVLQYVPPSERKRIMRQFKDCTNVGGLNVVDAFVEKNFIDVAPDWEHGKEFFWQSGELFSHYGADWKCELLRETYFNCTSGGTPHQHCMDTVIARKIV